MGPSHCICTCAFRVHSACILGACVDIPHSFRVGPNQPTHQNGPEGHVECAIGSVRRMHAQGTRRVCGMNTRRVRGMRQEGIRNGRRGYAEWMRRRRKVRGMIAEGTQNGWGGTQNGCGGYMRNGRGGYAE